ncbi:MAG: hypothetical protein ACT4P6_06900 [Gemmatimonadaceae bacterium]
MFDPKAGAATPDRNAIVRRRTDLESKVPMWMTAYNVPGVSIAVIENAQIAWRRGFGVKDVASLCEAGVMDIDTPLTKYTSERFLESDARLDLITARLVLTHTSGFRRHLGARPGD